MSVPMTLSDLERRDARVIFWRISSNNVPTVSCRMTEIGMVTQLGEKHVLGGQPGPYPQ